MRKLGQMGTDRNPRVFIDCSRKLLHALRYFRAR